MVKTKKLKLESKVYANDKKNKNMNICSKCWSENFVEKVCCKGSLVRIVEKLCRIFLCNRFVKKVRLKDLAESFVRKARRTPHGLNQIKFIKKSCWKASSGRFHVKSLRKNQPTFVCLFFAIISKYKVK